MTDAKTLGRIAFGAFHRALFGRTSQRWMMITEQARAAWEAAAEAVIDAADHDRAELVHALKWIYESLNNIGCDCGEESYNWEDHADYCPEYIQGYILSKLPDGETIPGYPYPADKEYPWETATAASEAAVTAASQQPAPTVMCKIYGSEVEFEMDVPEENLARTCQYIWDNPQEFSDFKANSEGAYYGFLKFLWVRRPDGREHRLNDIVGL